MVRHTDIYFEFLDRYKDALGVPCGQAADARGAQTLVPVR